MSTKPYFHLPLTSEESPKNASRSRPKHVRRLSATAFGIMAAAAAIIAVPHAFAADTDNRFNDIEPYYGAISLTNGGAQCTGGIKVKYNGKTALTTAGHCFDVNNKVKNHVWENNNYEVGGVFKKNSGHDIELIDTGVGDVGLDGKFWLDGTAFLKVSTIGPVIPGATGLAFSGQTSGVVSGLTIEQHNEAFTLPNGQGIIPSPFYLSEPCLCLGAQSGDSGAPVYYTSGGVTQVIGFVVGSIPSPKGNGRETVAVPAIGALSAIGATAITE